MKKNDLLTLLKANGIEKNAPDEQIRSVLVSASFNHDEIDTAILVLRENTKTNQSKVDGLHKVFRTDQTLSSAEISQLLGVNVDLEHRVIAGEKAREISTAAQIRLLFLAFILATTATFAYMYFMEIGYFHPSTYMQ